MSGKGDKWRGGWSQTYADNHKKIFGDKMKDEKQEEIGQLELTDDQKKELDDAWKEIMNDAKKVVDDYVENPSEESGSVVQIHEDSPFVDGNLQFNQWRKVVRGNVLEDIANKKDVDTKKKK